MKLLLDTHVLLWLLLEPERVPTTTLDRVRDTANEVFVSAITPFEIATKERLGQLPGAKSLLLAYSDYLRRFGATELPVSSHHGLVAGSLGWEHRDPFDRLIASQSIVESMPLVTGDSAFASLGAVQVTWG